MLQSEHRYQPGAAKATPELRRRLSLALMAGIALLLLVGIVYASYDALNDAFLHFPKAQQDGYSQQFTELQQTRRIDAYTVVLQKAYADVNQIVIFYTVKDAHGTTIRANDLLPMLSLADGTPLPWVYRAEKEISPVVPKRGTFIFDTEVLPAALTTVNLHLHLKHAPPPENRLQVEQALNAPGKVIDFEFTLLVHPGKSIPVNKSVTIAGRTLLLRRIQLSDTSERLFLVVPPSEEQRYSAQIEVAGKSFDAFPSRPNIQSGEVSYLLVDLAHDREGTWLLEMRPHLPYSDDVLPYSPTWRISLDWHYL